LNFPIGKVVDKAMVTPESAVAIFGSLHETGKRLIDIAKTIKNVEIQQLVAELNLSIADLKNDLADSRLEIVSFKTRIKELEDLLSISNNLSLQGVNYFDQDGNAFCSVCRTKGNVMPLQSMGDEFYCFSCKNSFPR
jgi:superfamily II helicase